MTAKKIAVAETYNEMQEALDVLADIYNISKHSCAMKRVQEKIGEYTDAEIDFHASVHME